MNRRDHGDGHLRPPAVGTLGHLADGFRQSLERFPADVLESALSPKTLEGLWVGAN